MMKNSLNISTISEGFVLDHIPAGKSMDIYKYLKYLLDQRPSSKWSDEQLEKLAPWSNEAKQLCNNN